MIGQLRDKPIRRLKEVGVGRGPIEPKFRISLCGLRTSQNVGIILLEGMPRIVTKFIGIKYISLTRKLYIYCL